MSPKTIVYLGGYARSGKSSLIEELRNRGYSCFSTSEILHEVASRFCLSFYLPVFFRHKTEKFDLGYSFFPCIKTGREWLITLAEDVLVPVFGRELFAHTASKRAIACDTPLVFIEAFNNEEQNLMSWYAQNIGNIQQELIFNIRRDREEPDADSRELLAGAIDIQNTQTIAELVDSLLKKINEKTTLPSPEKTVKGSD